LAIVALQGRTTDAAPIIISQPNAGYQAATTKIDISGLAIESFVTSVSDGTLTVLFSSNGGVSAALQVLEVPSTWGTWSSPPFSESATPIVLFNQAGTLTITLSQPAAIFGFELEANALSNGEFTAVFYGELGEITVGPLLAANVAGARLFAVSGDGDKFNRVVISGSDDFAIAQIRYALQQVDPPTTVPEPASAALWAFVALIGAGSLARSNLRRRHIHSQPRTTPA
jgi:hypothetical protein